MPSSGLEFYAFNSHENPLLGTPPRSQFDYLLSYLGGLNAISVIEETNYFDRDFLAEYSAFYAASSTIRASKCRRLHFFSVQVGKTEFETALRLGGNAKRQIEKYYLGFCVLRPLQGTPLGKTVLRWYEEDQPLTPRIIEPSRNYTIHLVGLNLVVKGLAWQQQDGGVAMCATIAVWTMLHSSAFFDYHSIPTTVDITLAAHEKASLGSRTFPSNGLTLIQVGEAVSNLGLAPITIYGNVPGRQNSFFTKRRLNGYLACLIRSGYPVLLGGNSRTMGIEGHHAVCAVGFRDAAPSIPSVGTINYQDENIEYFYIHDDNIGPSARFVIEEEDKFTSHGNNYVVLSRSSPMPSPATSHSHSRQFIPYALVAAVHIDMRLPIDQLFITGENIASRLIEVDKGMNTNSTLGLTLTFRIMKCYDYIGREIETILPNRSSNISRVKMELYERVPAMGLHVGVVRIGNGVVPLMDVLIDVTDSPHNAKVIAHLIWDSSVKPIVDYYIPFPSISINDYAPDLGSEIITY